MKFILLLVLIIFIACEQSTINVSSTKELMSAIKKPADRKNIILSPGTYELEPAGIIDSTCGNCIDSSEMVPATAGIVISGNNVQLSGPSDHSVKIITRAGYGLYFLNCKNASVKNIDISGGKRDSDSRASDAAIVVKNSTVRIENCIIHDNIGDSAIVVKNIVGIMGICGRENAYLTIIDNKIIRNSWDGIALYRMAHAKIFNNYIDGVDRATAKVAGGGRGVSIGVTWDATADIRGNIVKNYWKGIGIFVNGQASVQQNIIEDLLTWGIACWDADKGKPSAQIENNIIYNTGACGINLAVKESAKSENSFDGNIVVKTAQNSKYDSPDYYGYQCALSIFNIPQDFKLGKNLFFINRRAVDSLPDYDLDSTQFRDSLNTYVNKLENKFLKSSSFYVSFLK